MTTIREMVIADFPAIAKICTESDFTEVGGYWEPDILWQFMIQPYVKVFVAEERMEIKGFVSLDCSEWWGKRAKIIDFYLRRESRGTFTGYKLFKHTWNYLQNSDYYRVSAIVKSTNDKVSKMLLKHDWQLETTLRNYDNKGKTYFQFSKQLNGGIFR